MQNGTVTAFSPTKIIPIQIMRLILYGLIFFCGVIGNVLVILVVKCRGKKRTFHDYFLLNLAIADLLFIMCLPADIYIEVASFPFTHFYCKILYPLTTFAFSLSIFTLTSMAVGRCYVMKNTSKPPLKGRAAFLWIAVLWLSSFGCVLPLTIVASSAPKECREDWPDAIYRKAFTVSLLVLQYIGPLVIIAMAYVIIGILLIQSKSPQSLKGKKSQSLAQRIRHRNLQITRTLAVIVSLFALLMLPHEITWMLMDFGANPKSQLVDTLFKFSPILTYLHSCSNPLVYGLMTSQFRNDVRKYIFCCKRFKRPSQRRSEHHRETGDNTKRKKSRHINERPGLAQPHIDEMMSTSHVVGYGGKVNVIAYFSPNKNQTVSKTNLHKSVSEIIIKDGCFAKDSPSKCLKANSRKNIDKNTSASSIDTSKKDQNRTQIIINITTAMNGEKNDEEVPNNIKGKPSPVKADNIDLINNDTNYIQVEIVE